MFYFLAVLIVFIAFQTCSAFKCAHHMPENSAAHNIIAKMVANISEEFRNKGSADPLDFSRQLKTSPLLSLFGPLEKFEKKMKSYQHNEEHCSTSPPHQYCLEFKCEAIGGIYRGCVEPDATLGPSGTCRALVEKCNKLNEKMRVDGQTLCRICDGKDLCNAAKEKEKIAAISKADGLAIQSADSFAILVFTIFPLFFGKLLLI